MNKSIKYVLLAVVVIILVVLISQNSNDKKTIKIGVIVPITGNYGDIGQQIKRGIDIAIEDRSQKSNLKDIIVIYEDSVADPKTAISAYNKLTKVDNVKVIIVSNSSIAMALAPFAQKDKVILFGLYAVVTGFPEVGDYVFRNDINTRKEMQILSKLIYDKGNRKVALFSANTDGTVASTVEVEKFFNELGISIVYNEKYEKNETDYRSYLLKIKNLNPDAIFSINSSKQMGLLLKQARGLGIKQQIFSDWHAEGGEVLDIAGIDAEGLIYTHTFVQGSDEELVKNFVVSYENKYKEKTDYRSALAYDTLNIILSAVSDCKTRSTDCYRDNLLKVKDFAGVTGNTSIDAEGDTNKEIIVKTIKNSEFVVLK